MDGLKSEESLILPPASELLRNSKDDDKMVVDEPCNEISRESQPLLPSVQALSTQADEYIRHRMSDMSVSSQRMDNKILSPLEPSSQQVFNESLSLYYRRGSLVDPQSNSRRPSIAEMGSLPLPNSKVASRRGSLVASNDFDLSSRSPSPSSLASMKRYHDNDGFSVNNYPMPHHVASAAPSYDAFQRRHSIAVAVSSSSAPHNNTTDPEHIHSNSHLRNHVLNAKLNRGFRFPTSTQESNDYRTYSAPPSPPQTISNNVSYQEQLHENSRFNSFRRDSISRLHPTNNGGGGPMLPSNISRRRPSILDEAVEPSSSSLIADHLLTRRASMPVVPSLPKSRYMLERAPSQQPSRLNQLYGEEDDDERRTQEQYLQKNSGLRKETPYSRSPELRVSHKLAERKRRKEMKDLFDELRDSLPVEKSTKTSKWEILSKAVEYISMLKRRDYDMENEIAGLRRELEMIKRSRG